MTKPRSPRLPSRRQLLTGAGALAAICGLDAFLIEPRWLEITRHRIAIADLDAGLEGFTVAQISDAHLANVGVAIETLVEAVRAATPQLVVLSGDLIEAPEQLPRLAELCGGLREVTRSIVAIAGNWEHWGEVPMDQLDAVYRDAGATLMVNESRRIEGVTVAATDDGLGGAPDWGMTTRDLPASGPRLLLSHSPALLDRAPEALPRFDLALAGHTHGGQAAVGGWAPATPPGSGRFVAGHYQTKLGRAYVSRGTGTSVLPGRLLCRPELPLFELARA